ncbi:MAG: TetR/AcrR family transcriptional regulator [Synechococcales cyanobacterium RM1_1_8]|nr:TetR/AcrR family transcriptional regulator [Synechococcales cyanobacterium RM1_1_8]
MRLARRTVPPEAETKTRILKAAQQLFSRHGYDGTTTRDLAQSAGVAEGTLFRHFPNKKAILVELSTEGWIEILTDLLTELSEMSSYRAVEEVMRKRIKHLSENTDLMRVCLMETQFHPELQERIQRDVLDKMMVVSEAFFQTAIDRGIYRPINPKVIARIFLGMFMVAGFSEVAVLEANPSPQILQDMAEGLSDIFLNGVLA